MNTEHCHAVNPCRPSTTPVQDAMISGYVELICNSAPRKPALETHGEKRRSLDPVCVLVWLGGPIAAALMFIGLVTVLGRIF